MYYGVALLQPEVGYKFIEDLSRINAVVHTRTLICRANSITDAIITKCINLG